jgi:hypothetical protein
MIDDLETRLQADLPRLAAMLTEAPRIEPVSTERVVPPRRRLLVAVLVACVVVGATLVVISVAARHDNSPSASSTATPEPFAWETLPRSPLGSRDSVNPVWTGSEVLVWGGYRGGLLLQDGAAYNPATRTWRSLAPNQRASPSTVSTWMGDRFVVLDRNGGATYDPSTDTWRDLPRLLDGSFVGVAWTGTELLGVMNGSGVLVARYDPTIDEWIAGPTVPGNATPLEEAHVSVAWTGKQLVYWIGTTYGWAYTPAENSWKKLPTLPAPKPRTASSVAYVDGRIVVASSTHTAAGRRLVVAQLARHGWKTIATMPAGRLTQPVAVATHDAVVIIDRAGRTAPLEVTLRSGRHHVLAGYPLAPGTDTAAAWTGAGLFVWGGYPAGATASRSSLGSDAAWYAPTGNGPINSPK